MYVIQVGYNGYYAGDDREVTRLLSDVVSYPTEAAAEADATEIRETWNLKPARGATPAVKVVRLDAAKYLVPA